MSVHRHPHSFPLQLTRAGKYAYKWHVLGPRGHSIGAAESGNIPLDIKSTLIFTESMWTELQFYCLRNEGEGRA